MALFLWIFGDMSPWPFILLTIFILYTMHELYWKRRYLPPGPTPLLMLGNMLDVLYNLGNIDALLQKYRQKYGNIFTFWLGPIQMVMVCEINLMRKFFVKNGDVFSGRWRNFITDAMLDGFNGVVQVDGEKWREQRRFSLHVLRDFGFGRNFMEDKIMKEVDRFMKNLDKISQDGEVIEPERHLGVCVGNIINDILFGKTFEYTDPTFIRMQDILDNQSTIVLHPMMSLYLTLPFTVHIPFINRPWRRLIKLRDDFWSFLDIQIKEHKQRFESDECCELIDFTYVYLKEMERRKTSQKDGGFFNDLQLKMLLLDLFFAGSETTVTTTKWGILMMLLHPEIQKRVQQELDQLPLRIELSHRNKLIYLQATINEIQRIANILPINLLRTVTEDIEIDGFRFSAGSMVLPQISILMNDPSNFEEPERFNPDRFLDENQNLKKFDAFVPFSIGKRQCLGESLARAELFLIFGNLLRNFEFLPESLYPLANVYTDSLFHRPSSDVLRSVDYHNTTTNQQYLIFVSILNGS